MGRCVCTCRADWSGELPAEKEAYSWPVFELLPDLTAVGRVFCVVVEGGGREWNQAKSLKQALGPSFTSKGTQISPRALRPALGGRATLAGG